MEDITWPRRDTNFSSSVEKHLLVSAPFSFLFYDEFKVTKMLYKDV